MAEYCRFSRLGLAQCCSAPSAAQAIQQVHAAFSLVDNPVAHPVPAWASIHDACHGVRSCAVCHQSQYCLYATKGTPSCCSSAEADDAILAQAELGTAEILPVERSPMPDWISQEDHCVRTVSCDNCAVSEKLYCIYTRSGVPRCCSPPSGSSSPTDAIQIAAHHTDAPLDAHPLPSWAKPADVCITQRSCEACGVEQYCKYVGVGASLVTQCCSGATEEHKREHREYVAATLPIPDPFPAWANFATDLCMEKASCDECLPVSEYCHWDSNGQPSCCGKADRIVTIPNEVAAAAAALDEQYFAADAEDEESVVEPDRPDWATHHDKCAKIDSCAECQSTDTQYCKFTRLGNARCCVARDSPDSPVLTKLVDHDRERQADNGVPLWASSHDRCQQIASCYECLPGDTQYCNVHRSGETYCCKAIEESDTLPPAPASSERRAHRDDLPQWASRTDVCTDVQTCDQCRASTVQYCRHHRRTGVATCCRVANASDAAGDLPPPALERHPPVVADHVPRWASRLDTCTEVDSCDQCQASTVQYCRHTPDEGKPTCCRSIRAPMPSSDNADSTPGSDGGLSAAAQAAMEAAELQEQSAAAGESRQMDDGDGDGLSLAAQAALDSAAANAQNGVEEATPVAGGEDEGSNI